MNSPTEYDIYYTTDCTDPAVSQTRIRYIGKGIKITDPSDNPSRYASIEPGLMNQFYYDYKGEPINTKPDNSDVPKCFTLRAVAIAKDGSISEPVFASYFVGLSEESFAGKFKNNEIALISVITDPENLFDYEKGIYVNGKCFDEDNETPEREWKMANYRQKGREWERPVYIDFFENDGELKLSQRCGVRIQGGYSRGDIQKSLRFYARDEYQPDAKKFEYEFFKGLKDINGKPIKEFKKIMTRTGSNDAFLAKFSDVLFQSRIKNRKVSAQDGRACIVFLEGEYWGLYSLREDYDNNYFESHYGVDKDEVVMIKPDSYLKENGQYVLKVEEGKDKDLELYIQMRQWFKNADLSKAEDYAKACSYIDIESFVDYCAFEIYIRNIDWPGKNWACWRTRTVDSNNPYADGKWRWCVYDVEMGGDMWNFPGYNNNTVEDIYKNQYDENVALFFRKFAKNADFRNRLAAALESYAKNELSSSAMRQEIERYSQIYSLEERLRNLKRFPCVWQTINDGNARIERMRTFFNNRESYVLNTMIPWLNNANNFK